MIRSTLAMLFIASLPLVASAQSMKMPMGHTGPSTPAEKDSKAAMDAMMAEMAAPPTGDPDRDFVAMMIPHHQGAIAMAKIELRYGKDPVLRDLAQKIVDAQEHEIATMKAWQSQHGH